MRNKNNISLDNRFQRVGIYGVGLLGGSIGLALKIRRPETEIIGIGRSLERLQKGIDCGAVDSVTVEPGKIDPPLDLLIVCTPVRMVPQHVQQTLSSLKPGAIVTDVGSTKANVVRRCEAVMNQKAVFVGSHPMAGSHHTSVDYSAPELLEDKICVVTETPHVDNGVLETIEGFWSTLGMRVIRMTPEIHDRMTARSSHLPHLLAAALCNVARDLGEDIKPVLGSGFRDTTRIAAGDPGMWLDICMENPNEILAALESLQTSLDNIKQSIQKGHEESILQFLRQAQEWKQSI